MQTPNENDIRELIGPFVDAGTALGVREADAGTVEVTGQRRFQQFRFRLRADDQGNLLVPRRGGSVSLSQHLSSGAFADLDKLAKSTLPFLKNRLSRPEYVIEGKVALHSDVAEPTGPDVPAFSAVERALYAPAGLGTAVTFVHGDAGAGKSWLLMRVALQHANEYLQRKRPQFPLYIDAQGVNLRTIALQIAHQLDVYNGVLRYSEVVPLVRLGAIGLIIDGFDELIMPSGYNDTLKALLNYVNEFKGDGAIVASARTSFLHAYAVAPAVAEPSHPYSANYLRLRPWTSLERRQYSKIHGREAFADAVEDIAGAEEVNLELLGRPFLVYHVYNLLANGEQVHPKRLLERVEDAFIERERREKLTDPDTEQPLLTREQFDHLLEEVAEEMWLLRQNSLDLESARLVAALVSEYFRLSRGDREIVEQRIQTHSFLEAEPDGRVRFPHEIVFSRIMAKRMLRWLREGEAQKLTDLLRVAPLKVSMAEQFASLVAPLFRVNTKVSADLSRLADVASHTRRSDDDAAVRLNLGSLVGFLLPFRPAKGQLHLSKLHFAGIGFQGARLSGVVFEECFLQNVDARKADWSAVQFVDCYPITKLTIDAGQILPDGLPSVSQLDVYYEDGKMRSIFGSRPTRREIFGERKAEDEEGVSPEAREALEVLEGLCRKAQKGHHWFNFQDFERESPVRHLARREQWAVVIEALERHELMVIERRSKSGPDAELAHVVNPGAILAAIGGDSGDNRVRALLRELKRI